MKTRKCIFYHIHIIRSRNLHSGSDTSCLTKELRTYLYKNSGFKVIFSLRDLPYIMTKTIDDNTYQLISAFQRDFRIHATVHSRFHIPAVWPNHRLAAYFSPEYYRILPLNFPVCTIPVLPR